MHIFICLYFELGAAPFDWWHMKWRNKKKKEKNYNHIYTTFESVRLLVLLFYFKFTHKMKLNIEQIKWIY